MKQDAARAGATGAAVLRFLDDLAAPFDNSPAEWDVRMMRVEQKVSGGCRTPVGADTFCTNRGYLSTAPKHGQHAPPSSVTPSWNTPSCRPFRRT